MCILTIAVVITYFQYGLCACVCGWQPTNNGKLKTHLAVEHCFNRQEVSSSGSGTFSYTNISSKVEEEAETVDCLSCE